jgi:hypothetical protein
MPLEVLGTKGLEQPPLPSLGIQQFPEGFCHSNILPVLVCCPCGGVSSGNAKMPPNLQETDQGLLAIIEQREIQINKGSF